MDSDYQFPCISVNLSKLSHEQVSSLKQANAALEMEFVCLTRIRDPLAMVGGYWNMDPKIIFKITTGMLQTAIGGIEQMRANFTSMRNMPEVSEETRRDIGLFLERSGTWVEVNQITQSP
ncbi:hypothetical protein LPJ59_006311 [Coemansia sp. RSA 2399]|nr:hypothetical protein LPJ59_006311 [Coemansia sp. RSA 2399]KAJ1888764.1 hypothetical protein LPJ81_006256 [Coemansia sp. IMI 209127]